MNKYNRPIDELRDEVRRAHRNATKKVSRLRAKGVEVGGTRNDPRRDLGRVKGYTEKQLKTYLRQLDTFRDRSKSFGTGAGGAIIPGDKWREYKRLEKQYNTLAKRNYERVSSTLLPGQGMTIAERDGLMRSDLPRATGQRRPNDPINRSMRGVKSERALEVLTRDMRKRLSPDYEAKVVRRQRSVARKMVSETGTKRFRKAVAGLTDAQFNTVWNYTNLPRLLSMWYETRQSDASEEWIAKSRDDSGDSIEEILKWAKTL